MLPAHGALHSPAYRKTTRFAAVAACTLALVIFIFAFVPAVAETPYENPLFLFLLNATFLSAVSVLVAGLALVGYVRSGRIEPLMLGCAVLFSGLGALIAGLVAGGERSPNDFVAVHNVGVLLAAAMHLATACVTARHAPAAAPASLRLAVGAYGATVGIMLLVLAAERADVLPMFYIAGSGSTRIRQLALTGAIAMMSTAAGLVGLEARRLSGVSLRFYSLGLGLTALGLTGAFLSSPGSLLSWAGRGVQYAGNLYLLAAILIFIRLARRQQVEVRLAVAEFFSESTDHYRALVENMRGAVVSIDTAGKIFLWNPAAERIFGYPADEAIGRPFSDLVAAAEEGDRLRAALDPAGQAPVEVPLRRRDGSIFTAEMSSVSAGRAGSSVIIRDITDRHNAEDALRRAYELRRLALEAADMGAWDYRFDTGEVFWDQRCRLMWGVPDCDQISYDAAIDRIHPEDRSAVDAAVKRAIDGADDGAYRQEFRVVWPDGTIRWVSSRGRVFFNKEGGQRLAARFIGANRDITERMRDIHALRESEGALQRANESLELRVAERTGMLERTVAVLKREVEERRKTAGELSAANQQLEARAGQLRALAGELTMAEHRERHRTGKILHDHLQQILSSAKMQVSCLRREREVPLDAVARIEEAMGEAIQVTRSLTGELSPPILQVAGLKAGLDWLARRTAERLGVEVAVSACCDPTLSEQMKILVFESVRELLFNCAKHSGAGRADVRVACDEATLHVTVSDSGSGFDPQCLTTPGDTRTGFGLFAIRERIQLVGGSFEVESAPNAGSRFRMCLPLADSGPGPAPPQSTSSKGRIRVLIADDHAIMLEGLTVMLSKEPDIEVVGQARDGRQAVEMTRRLTPDVVLMDIGMPGLNGIEATRIIHAEMPRVRVLGLSMLYEEGEGAEAMREAGAVAYVTKSAPSSEVLAALRSCMSGGGNEPVRRHEPYV